MCSVVLRHLWWSCLGNASQLYANQLYLNTAWRPCEVRWQFARTICTVALLREFYSQTHKLFSLFGCMYQPTSPFCPHWTNLPRTLLEVTSQIAWNIHAIAFKAAWLAIGGWSWYQVVLHLHRQTSPVKSLWILRLSGPLTLLNFTEHPFESWGFLGRVHIHHCKDLDFLGQLLDDAPLGISGTDSFTSPNFTDKAPLEWLSKTCISVCIYHSQSVLMLLKFEEGGEACKISTNLSLHTAL